MKFITSTCLGDTWGIYRGYFYVYYMLQDPAWKRGSRCVRLAHVFTRPCRMIAYVSDPQMAHGDRAPFILYDHLSDRQSGDGNPFGEMSLATDDVNLTFSQNCSYTTHVLCIEQWLYK